MAEWSKYNAAFITVGRSFFSRPMLMAVNITAMTLLAYCVNVHVPASHCVPFVIVQGKKHIKYIREMYKEKCTDQLFCPFSTGQVCVWESNVPGRTLCVCASVCNVFARQICVCFCVCVFFKPTSLCALWESFQDFQATLFVKEGGSD